MWLTYSLPSVDTNVMWQTLKKILKKNKLYIYMDCQIFHFF